MECPTCGQPIRIGSRLCPNCGVWLVEDDILPPQAFGSGKRTGFPTAGRVDTAAPSDLSAFGPPSPTQRIDQPAPFTEFVNTAPFDDELDEMTTLSARRKKPSYWTITLPDGVVELVTDRLVIGRQPEFMPALPTARLIPVADPTRSVSKNHACFSLYGANLVVEDLGSTNGIIVTRPDGHEHDIGVGGRTELEDGSRVELGDVVLHVGKV